MSFACVALVAPRGAAGSPPLIAGAPVRHRRGRPRETTDASLLLHVSHVTHDAHVTHVTHFFVLESPSESEDSTAMKASCGTSTLPTIFIRFLPSFCFSSSFRLREMSPP